MVAHAAQQGMDYVIVRPTAYFKDFTSFPLRKMQVGAASAPAELSCFCALLALWHWRCDITPCLVGGGDCAAAGALEPAATGCTGSLTTGPTLTAWTASALLTLLYCTALHCTAGGHHHDAHW